MKIHTNKTQKNQSQLTANGTPQTKESGGDSTFQFMDNRPEALAQEKLQDMADNYTANKSPLISIKSNVLAKEAAPKTGLMHFSGRNAPLQKTQAHSGANLPIQRKEETDLTPGVLNMIGETHTDYPNESYRKYESAQIKEKLGSDNSYFSESQLKTQSSELDFSDPLDLRVEQLVAFTKDEAPNLVSRLKAINLGLVTDIKEKEEVGAKDKAIQIIEELIPSLTVEKSGFDPEPILASLSEHSPAILQILSKSDVWLEVEFDKELDEDPNFSSNSSKVQFGIDNLLAPKEQTEEQKETLKAFQCFIDTDNFFEQYKGRIPGTLKLYYELRSNDDYSTQGKYNFSINEIPYILDNWNKLDELLSILRTSLYKQDFKHLNKFIEIAALKLENIVDGMLAGAQGNKANKTKTVIEKRSIKMHEAAQELVDSNIAWKVGDLHIKDIQELQNDGTIPQTDYAYITKDNFKANNFDEEDAKEYSGDAELADETEIKAKIGLADTMIEGHRDGLNSADIKANASEEYHNGYQQGQRQLTDEIASPQASRAIQRWLQRAREENEWDKIRKLCAENGGKVAVLRAGLSMSDLDKMDPNFEITFEEEYQKYDPTKFLLWRWSNHVFVRKRFGIDQD